MFVGLIFFGCFTEIVYNYIKELYGYKISRNPQYTNQQERGILWLANFTAVNPAFGVNNFNETKYYSPDESLVRDILLVLFGKPGFYPSLPYLGMHIQDYLYALEDDMDTTQIKAKLASQCMDLLPLLQNGDMDIFASHWKGNPLLVFKLPVIRETEYSDLVLGVTILKNGEMQFNFVFNDKQQYI